MNNQTDNQTSPSAPSATTTVNEKHVALVSKTSDFITRWRAPFVSLLSYGLILGLAATGMTLMGISAIIGLFFDTTTHSGFGFLTGGVFLAVSCTMTLWKMTHTLKILNDQKNKLNPAQ